MRPPYYIPLWKQVPVARILLAFMAGILVGWYAAFSLSYILTCLGCFTAVFSLSNFLPPALLFRFKLYRGIVFFLIILSFGMLLVWQKDERRKPGWYGRFLTDSSVLQATIHEPPVVKPRSVKAEVSVNMVINGRQKKMTSGKLLLYFSKDSSLADLRYGDMILMNNKLQPIRNSGNPGAFDYERYAAFQGLYQQVFLTSKDWVRLQGSGGNHFRHFLFETRQYVLSALKRYIPNRHNEPGIAEALLIGYKEDLDKDLVQAYSNTGVVHIIAISGLHLGLIYAVLLWLLNRVPVLKRSRHAKVVLLISSLWLFALLTGGSASVLRSAVMFTVIVAGKYYFRQSSVYNSLATSAFILLCYNPFFLWDVGFQLSYCAVIGIVSLQQFIYRQWYISNWCGRQLWSMASVTIAAQLTAFPLCIYYFHQFPNMFLLTNLVAVPLSTVILFAEILLVIIAPLHAAATWLGKITGLFIYIMNEVILFFDSFSFSVWDNIYADVFTSLSLYTFLFFVMAGWMNSRRRYFHISLFCLALFTALHTLYFLQAQQQRKIIIYNVSRHRAVDFIDRDRFVFAGDSILSQPGLQQNFHLKPARIALQATHAEESLPALRQQNGYYSFYHKKIVMIDSSAVFSMPAGSKKTDVLLLSHNPAVDIEEVIKLVSPAIIVFDASNSLWKIQQWKRECEALILRYHSVAEEGAFVLEVDSSMVDNP